MKQQCSVLASQLHMLSPPRLHPPAAAIHAPLIPGLQAGASLSQVAHHVSLPLAHRCKHSTVLVPCRQALGTCKAARTLLLGPRQV